MTTTQNFALPATPDLRVYPNNRAPEAGVVAHRLPSVSASSAATSQPFPPAGVPRFTQTTGAHDGQDTLCAPFRACRRLERLPVVSLNEYPQQGPGGFRNPRSTQMRPGAYLHQAMPYNSRPSRLPFMFQPRYILCHHHHHLTHTVQFVPLRRHQSRPPLQRTPTHLPQGTLRGNSNHRSPRDRILIPIPQVYTVHYIVQPVMPQTLYLGSADEGTRSHEDMSMFYENPQEDRTHGMTIADINKLPSYRFNRSDHQCEHIECVICMYDFETEELLRALPCSHAFHAECVDKWLEINRTCPICRINIYIGT